MGESRHGGEASEGLAGGQGWRKAAFTVPARTSFTDGLWDFHLHSHIPRTSMKAAGNGKTFLIHVMPCQSISDKPDFQLLCIVYEPIRRNAWLPPWWSFIIEVIQGFFATVANAWCLHGWSRHSHCDNERWSDEAV